MLNSYFRFGRRIPLPSTIEILDELDPGYRKRLILEKRGRPTLPKAVVLPRWSPKARNVWP